LFFGAACFGAGVIGDDSNERIGSWVESFDSSERCFNEIGGRDALLAKQARGLLDGKKG
jgi:hypothetical protein